MKHHWETSSFEPKNEEIMGTFLSVTNESLIEVEPPQSQRKKNKRKSWIKGHQANVYLKINGKTGSSRWKNCCYWLILKKAELTNIFVHIFFVYLFSWNMNFVHIWRVFIFANAVWKKISRVFNFAKSTRIYEILENMYTLKLVRLS